MATAIPPVTPRVAFARPDLDDLEIDSVVAALRSGWLTTGPRTAEFERRFAEYTDARHAVAVSSCSAALHLALLACEATAGCDVITTPLTFCATVNAIIHAGARPVFADVDRDTMNIDPAAVSSTMTPATVAVVPVHFGGLPAAVDEIAALAHRQAAVVIEDAAHCLEGRTGGRKVGAIGDVTCFSFYATKNLTTGEGGMATTASPELATRMRTAARHGISQSAWSRHQPHRDADYEVVCAGFKYNMTDLQASLGLAQLQRLPTLAARRRRVWDRYEEALRPLPLVRPAATPPGVERAHHLYTVLVDPKQCGTTRDELRENLSRRGVQTSIHFRALHLQPYYAERFKLRRGMFPHAEYISDRTLSLPLSPGLSDAEVSHVIESLRGILAERASRSRSSPPLRGLRSVPNPRVPGGVAPGKGADR